MVDAASAPASDVEVVEAEASDGVRSPVDVLRLLVAVFLVVAVLVADALFGETLVSFASELFAGLSAVPDWIVDVVVLGSRVLAAVLLVVGLAVVLRTGRWRVAATLVLAAGVAAGLMALLDVFDPAPDEAPVEVIAAGFPSAAGLAAVTAATTAAAPGCRAGGASGGGSRRVGWPSRASSPRRPRSPRSRPCCSDGSSGPRRSSRSAVRGADHAGRRSPPVWRTSVSRSSASSRPASTPGARRRTSRRPRRRRLFVKALGDDERSADLLFRLYRRVSPATWATSGRSRRCAGRSSTRRSWPWRPATSACARRTCRPGPCRATGFILAYEAIEGRSLDRLDPDEVTDEVLAAVWTRWRSFGATASPTGTCGWPTSSSARTGGCG